MSQTPFEFVGGLRIGTVEFVSPDEIKVLLDIESPESMALNTGTPHPFPRVNSYVLIQNDEGFLVGQIEWLTVEHSDFPKRRGMQDFGLVGLPYPLRKMKLNPLGTLRKRNECTKEEEYTFHRGVEAFPSIGDGVFLPTEKQLRSIVESGEKRRVKIGTSPLAGYADVSVNPDRLFGRHLAVLGNTGSGKSCTVAGLIRWSLETVQKEEKNTNAWFIVLDPNGEYARAFTNKNDKITARVFKVDLTPKKKSLQVPIWFWNSAEWCSFSQASERAQRPLLRRALREVRNPETNDTLYETNFCLRRKISTILITIRHQVRNGNNYEGWKFGPKLVSFVEDINSYIHEYPQYSQQLLAIKQKIENVLRRPGQTYLSNGSTRYNDFSETSIDPIIKELENCLKGLGGIIYQSGPNEDCPISYKGNEFADHLQELAEQENNPQFFDFLIMRIRTMLSDERINSIIGDFFDITLEQWLSEYIGSDKAENGCLSIIDLSLVPTEIIHIINAVIARMIFEALQRYRNLNKNGLSLPTVLVMEEAHNFIKRYKDDAENHDAAAMCCQVFEKIAREGRKFGLGLLLSSQRPSELSPTVLSQCNTFILHRISNDRDQELVNKLVPDNLRGLLRELPSLPSQNAILLGWASELPVLVRMNDLPKSQQPQSEDPDFWAVWTGKDDNGKAIERNIDWTKVARDWQGQGEDEDVETAEPLIAANEEPEGLS
jgi:hypothetical protein